ncbi:MAG: ester cyclase [Actinomycetota bacterium]
MGASADVVGRKIEAFNGHDAAGILAAYGADCVEEAPGTTLHGSGEVVAYFSVFWDAFPDLRFTLERLVEEGASVAVFGRCTGVHRGPLRAPGGDVAPTGRGLDLPVSTFYDIRDGRIASARLTFDQATLLGQLGLMPAPASA